MRVRATFTPAEGYFAGCPLLITATIDPGRNPYLSPGSVRTYDGPRIAGVTVTAISGIEIALHDLVGKILEVPAYQLLGGKYRDAVRVYCDCHAGEAYELEDGFPTIHEDEAYAPEAYADEAERVAREPGDREADPGVDEAEHRPRRREREGDEEHHVEHREPVRREDGGRRPEQREEARERQRRDEAATPRDRPHLDSARRRMGRTRRRRARIARLGERLRADQVGRAHEIVHRGSSGNAGGAGPRGSARKEGPR